jgi:hypothetical protein
MQAFGGETGRSKSQGDGALRLPDDIPASAPDLPPGILTSDNPLEMKFTYLFLAAFPLLSAIGCAEKKDPYDTLAKDLCQCMLPMADFQLAFAEALENADSADETALQELFAEAEQIDRRTQDCFSSMEEKYGTLGSEEQAEKIFSALEKTCPDIMARLNEGMAPGVAPEEFMDEEEFIHDEHGEEAPH